MPIYEYECEKCHETFELLQSIHDAPIKKCSHCSGKVRRIVSPPAILFKGSGFHVTDYRSGSAGSISTTPDSEKKPAASSDKSDKKEKSKPDSSSPPNPKNNQSKSA